MLSFTPLLLAAFPSVQYRLYGSNLTNAPRWTVHGVGDPSDFKLFETYELGDESVEPFAVPFSIVTTSLIVFFCCCVIYKMI